MLEPAPHLPFFLSPLHLNNFLKTRISLIDVLLCDHDLHLRPILVPPKRVEPDRVDFFKIGQQLNDIALIHLPHNFGKTLGLFPLLRRFASQWILFLFEVEQLELLESFYILLPLFSVFF